MGKDPMKPVPRATRCRCGTYLPKGAMVRWDEDYREYYDCAVCRPREEKRDE